MTNDYETNQFYQSLTDWGSMDVETALEKAQEVGINGSELADLVRELLSDTGIELSKIDVCYVIYDHILQQARNKIDEVLNFDICNDMKGETQFYTYGNAMCTSFDYSSEAQEQLQEKIKNATREQKDELLEDVFVKVFLNDVDVKIPKSREELRKNE